MAGDSSSNYYSKKLVLTTTKNKDMKATLILINFALSFIGLCIDTATGPIIAPILGVTWFCASCYILYRADKSGVMDKLKEKLDFDNL